MTCYAPAPLIKVEATDYLEVKASCSLIAPEQGDYTTSDIIWSDLKRSICNFPPGNQDISPESVTPFSVNTDYSTADLYPLIDISNRRPTVADTSDAFAPYSCATLTFMVETGNFIYDPATGNYISEIVPISYSAWLKVMPPNQFWNPGIDFSTYLLEGRLISPTIFDPKIQNGAEAKAIFNGYKGRFVYKVDLDIPPFYTNSGEVNDHIQGTFFIVGGGK